MLSLVVLSTFTKSKNTSLILGETSFLRSKNLRQTLNIYGFAYLSVNSLPMIEKKAPVFPLNRLCNFRPNILSSDANDFLLYSFWGACSISPTSK